jgi:hypothetical protein
MLGRQRGAQRFEQGPELELAELQEGPPRPRAQLESKPNRNSDWKPAVDIGEGVARSFNLRLQHGRKRRDLQRDLDRAREREIFPHFNSLQDGLVEHRNEERDAEALPEVRVSTYRDTMGVGGIQVTGSIERRAASRKNPISWEIVKSARRRRGSRPRPWRARHPL